MSGPLVGVSDIDIDIGTNHGDCASGRRLTRCSVAAKECNLERHDSLALTLHWPLGLSTNLCPQGYFYVAEALKTKSCTTTKHRTLVLI